MKLSPTNTCKHAGPLRLRDLRSPSNFKMTTPRRILDPDSLILGSILVAAAATIALMTFLFNGVVWQILSWTFIVALLVLLVAVSSAAYSLATNRTSRNWKRIGCFLLGFSCLAIIVGQSI